MKKNWKEYSPNDNSWGKIMQKQDFDSQLEQNLSQLPGHMPSDFAWGAIEDRLEKKKRGFIWRPFLIAASLTGLFLLAFYLIRQGAAVLDVQDVPEEILAVELNPTQMEDAPNEILEETTTPVDNSSSSISDQKIVQRSVLEPISAPKNPVAFAGKLKTKAPDLEPRNHYIASPPVEEVPSYHSVAISWGLKEKKLEVTFPFGKQTLDKTTQVQAKTSQNTKRIRIGERN